MIEDTPPSLSFIFTGTSNTVFPLFNTSTVDIGSGYSVGYELAKCFKTFLSTALNPLVVSYIFFLVLNFITKDIKLIPTRLALEDLNSLEFLSINL